MNAQDLCDTEEEIRKLWEAGELPYLTHLMGGNEDWLCDFFRENIKPTDWVFASHRCHFHFLLHHRDRGFIDYPGAVLSPSEELIRRVRAGKSMFLYGPRFICSAIVAGTAAIAVGVARSIQMRGGSERVFAFCGDGATDEGHWWEAIRHAEAMDLPITFIVEDNNGSCGVTKTQRGSLDDDLSSPKVVHHRYALAWPHAGTSVRPTLKRTTP